MSERFWLTGLIPATFTPMHDDGALNLAQVAPLVERLLAQGVSGLYVCGSTGEGVSLTREERMETVAAFVRAADGRVPVIAQVGHNSLAEARLLAQAAAQAGADAISATPPMYFKPATPEVLVECLAEIAAAAPALPFYYYHIPPMTGVSVDVADLLVQAGPRIPSLAGAKFSSTALYELQAAVQAAEGRYNLLFGSDEMLLGGLLAGAHGAVGSTYNFAAPLYLRVIRALEAGDLAEARRLQGLAVTMVRTMIRHGGNPALKAVMALLGVDCGPSRLPQVTLDPARRAALRADLEAMDFFGRMAADP